jgi:YidC/Oxa1 family membrane protein insertase
LIGMFYLLKSSFPLRGAVFIPGWIDDLSAPDVLFTWGKPLWFIGNEFHLLPILMGITMYLQQKFSSKIPKDTSKLSDEQKQQKMMGNMMAVLFTVMFYNFPSGLNIYFMLSTLLGVAQQMWITKKCMSGNNLSRR